MWKKKRIENGCVSFAFKYIFTWVSHKFPRDIFDLISIGAHAFFSKFHILFVNRGDPDQSKPSDQDLHCFTSTQ